MSTCKHCGGPLPADRHYTEFCTGAHYKRSLRTDAGYAERDRAASRAWKDANREANRARDRMYSRLPDQRGVCTDCGELRGVGSAHRGEGRCEACVHKAAQQRDQQIVDLYEAGVPLTQMAVEMGITLGAISRDVNRLRNQGRIGYRYAGWAAKAAA